MRHLVGHGGEAAEAHELGDIDADGAGAGERQEGERGHVPVVVEHPGVADVAVQEGPQQQQRPCLHVKCSIRSASVTKRSTGVEDVHVPDVGEHSAMADVAVQEGPQQQQRPCLLTGSTPCDIHCRGGPVTRACSSYC